MAELPHAASPSLPRNGVAAGSAHARPSNVGVLNPHGQPKRGVFDAQSTLFIRYAARLVFRDKLLGPASTPRIFGLALAKGRG